MKFVLETVRPKPRRLVFFALETTLLATTTLGLAGNVLQRKIYDPMVALILTSLSIFSFLGLPTWCAIYHNHEPQLARVAAITLLGWILLAFLVTL